MKKIFLPFFALFFAAQLDAQAPAHHPRNCGVTDHETFLQQKNPGRAAERAAYEQSLQQAGQRKGNTTQSVVTIPVVVHVVYNTTQQNISANQVLSQIQVLNEDFTRTNADASQTPSAFQSAAASAGIQFCLAQQDPSGNYTSGIERRQTTVTSFTDDDAVKAYSTGGLDAWDPTRYFNIWVCNLGSYLLGYAEFPSGSASSTYGVVIGTTYFGSNYTSYGSSFNLDPYYNRGRTTTHEIGHCFDLYHIWGDDFGSCAGTDLCADTPNQASETYGAPTFPQTDNCSSTSPGIMFMNYMDYTDDIAMNMFTANQAARVQGVVTSAPYNALATSNACQLNSVQDQTSLLAVTIFPNPSNDGRFGLSVSSADRNELQVKITDALGRTVSVYTETSVSGGTYPIDLSAQPNGVYFVEISAGNARTVERIVISR